MVAGDTGGIEGAAVEAERVEPERNLRQRLACLLLGGGNRQQIGDLALGVRRLGHALAPPRTSVDGDRHPPPNSFLDSSAASHSPAGCPRLFLSRARPAPAGLSY